MRQPPPLADVRRYPVTVSVGVLAAVTTLAWHSGRDIAPLFMSNRAWRGEPWRLLTSALPHVDVIHLLFNLYWLWVFGAAVEAVYGRLRTAAIILFFAAGSAAAEFAVFQGGVGLSGVGYGFFGLLWMLSHWDDRFDDVVDSQTIALFIFWFFLCIALTIRGIWAVANVAHGFGALQGILLGMALASPRGQKIAAFGLAGLMAVVVAAATVFRPFVSFSSVAGQEWAYDGWTELEAHRSERAAALLQEALRFDDRQADWWYNLGIAQERAGRGREATEAFQRAADLSPLSAFFRSGLAASLTLRADEHALVGDNVAAAEFYRKSLDLDDKNVMNWNKLGLAYSNLGRAEDAKRAFEKATGTRRKDAMEKKESD
jgi:membrane associated rhomboid family serine protease